MNGSLLDTLLHHCLPRAPTSYKRHYTVDFRLPLWPLGPQYVIDYLAVPLFETSRWLPLNLPPSIALFEQTIVTRCLRDPAAPLGPSVAFVCGGEGVTTFPVVAEECTGRVTSRYEPLRAVTRRRNGRNGAAMTTAGIRQPWLQPISRRTNSNTARRHTEPELLLCCFAVALMTKPVIF